MQQKIFAALKSIFFILLIPVIVATTSSFVAELQTQEARIVKAFLYGIITFLIVYIFVFEPKGVYSYGQKIVSDIFRFFDPLVDVAPYFFPIFSLLTLMLFYFSQLIWKTGPYESYFMFFLSFTLAMHFVFTAHSLREKDNNVLRPNYFFSIALIYVANMLIVGFFLGEIFNSFSGGHFFSSISDGTREIYMTIFTQLFEVS